LPVTSFPNSYFFNFILSMLFYSIITINEITVINNIGPSICDITIMVL